MELNLNATNRNVNLPPTESVEQPEMGTDGYAKYYAGHESEPYTELKTKTSLNATTNPDSDYEVHINDVQTTLTNNKETEQKRDSLESPSYINLP